MTRATYNTDNTLTELPGMAEPSNYNETGFLNPAYHVEKQSYQNHLESLRTLVCSPECRGLWKSGQVLEEGKDYDVKGAGDWKWCYQPKGNVFAAPVVPASAEEEAKALSKIIKSYTETETRYVGNGCNHESYVLGDNISPMCNEISRMYTDTIDKLKAELNDLKTKLYGQKHNL